jgi:hypothetical protein
MLLEYKSYLTAPRKEVDMGIARLMLVALTFGLAVAAPSAMAQGQGQNYGDPGQNADWAQPDQDQMGVNMTLYHVVRGADGQELMVTPGGQAIPLPGAGVVGRRVAVYHGSHGGTWYVDRNGQQVDLPAMEPGFYSNAATAPGEYAGGAPQGSYVAQGQYAPVAPYYGPYGGNQYQNYYPPQEYNQQQQPPQATASATVNTTGGGNGSGGGGGGLGGFAGGLIGSALGSAVGDLAGGGIPYGAPVYEGGGGPYYYGGGGRRFVVNNNNFNSEHFNEWHNQQNWYRNQFNDGGRYNHRSWPGKDHGFPPPWEGNNGRLYGNHHDGADGGRHDGGEGRHDGGGEGRHDGGGEGRHDGGEHHGGGEHHEGGGEHHGGGGGGHRGGGGGHHGGGGGHRK